MNTETITVQYVNQPKPGKKMGSIKTQDGRYLGCWPDKLGQFQKGGTYVVETETTGDFTKIKGLASNGQQTAAPAPAKANGHAKPTDDATAERIYCCGIINAAISGGSLTLSTASLVAATNAARQAWAQTFGGKAQQGDERANQLPDDEVPF